jgi:HEAT repeat protein
MFKNVFLPVLLTLIAGQSAITGWAQNPTPLVNRTEAQWLEVLKSTTSQKEQMDACRELSVIGSAKAVPALVALLGDEKLNHSARYALETISDSAVDAALRKALKTTQGRPLIGVITSLGVRRDAKAVEPLSDLLRQTEADVMEAAARAMGRIGTLAAAKALQAALPRTPATSQLAVCEGLFRAAESLSAAGRRNEAAAIYDQVRRQSGMPQQVRAGALRGALLLAGDNGAALLVEALRSDDFVLAAAAARTAHELPGAWVTRTLATELNQSPADKQVLLIQALAWRRDRSAMPSLSTLAAQGDPAVRVAALRALPEFGDGSAASTLAAHLADADRAVAQAAMECLAGLPGREAEATVNRLLASTQPREVMSGIDLAGRRRMASAVPRLLELARVEDTSTRQAALRRVGELGSTAELVSLLDLLNRSTQREDFDALEQALIAVCGRATDPASVVDLLAARLPAMPSAQKATLLTVLATLGGPKALATVRAAANDPEAEVRRAAIRALSDWKTVDAAAELYELLSAPKTPEERALAMRGYLGWAANTDAPVDERMKICAQATPRIQQDDEKRLLLRALGGIKTRASLTQVLPYLDQAATKEEACAAIVAISEELLKTTGPVAADVARTLIEPLQKAVEATSNADLAGRAKTQLRQAQTKAGQ